MALLKIDNSGIIQDGKTRKLTNNELTGILRALKTEEINWHSNLTEMTININSPKSGNVRFWKVLNK